MIFDKLESITEYSFKNPRINKAISFITGTDLRTLPAGRTEVDGEDVYINKVEYTTSDIKEKEFEAHKDYIDMHIILSGEEFIGCTHISNITVTKEYDPAGDALLGKSDEGCTLTLKDGYFLICFPQDAHLVGACKDSPGKVKKCIVKIKI